MIKPTKIALLILLIAMPQAALSKAFKEKDSSKNNSCTYVHDWFKKNQQKHSVYVTSGGVPFKDGHDKGEVCQAGGGSTLAIAKGYAIGRCESFRRKRGIQLACKVVESR